MKVLLIEPGSPFLLDARVFVSLGILQVATVLRDAGHDVAFEDYNARPNYLDLLDMAIKRGWDCYALTATTPQFPDAVRILRYIRENDPGKRVIIGGPHATISPESCSEFDCVVRGDGVITALQAVEPTAPSIIDAASNTKKGTLDWRWPSYDLADMDSYRYSLHGIKGTNILTEMGCPFFCGFCAGRNTPFYRRVRYRPVDDIVNELRFLMDRYGVGAFTDFSDEINLLNEPLLELCKKVKPLGAKFRAFIKANLFTDFQAEAMADAGFVECCSGVESGSDRILGVINKQTTAVINKRFVDLCRKHGMRSKAFMSLAQAGETLESAMESRDWLIATRPDDFDITIVTVYPSTPYWDEREFVGVVDGNRVCKYVRKSKRPEENGATLFFEEVDYSKKFLWYKGIPGQYVSHTWTPDLSKEDFVKLRDQIEDDVRKALNIPYPKRFSGDYLSGEQNFDHSMGQGANPQDSRVLVRG